MNMKKFNEFRKNAIFCVVNLNPITNEEFEKVRVCLKNSGERDSVVFIKSGLDEKFSLDEKINYLTLSDKDMFYGKKVTYVSVDENFTYEDIYDYLKSNYDKLFCVNSLQENVNTFLKYEGTENIQINNLDKGLPEDLSTIYKNKINLVESYFKIYESLLDFNNYLTIDGDYNREDLVQFTPDQVYDFIEYLRKDGIIVDDVEKNVLDIRYAQNSVSFKKVRELIDFYTSFEAKDKDFVHVILDKNNVLLDGHHTLFSKRIIYNNSTIRGFVVDLEFEMLLKKAKTFLSFILEDTNTEITKDKQDREKEQLKQRQDLEMAKAREKDFKDKEREREQERKQKEAEKKAEANEELQLEYHEEGTDEIVDAYLDCVPEQSINNDEVVVKFKDFVNK